MLFYWNILFKYGAQTRYCNPYGHWPYSFLVKSISLFFECKHSQNLISKKPTRAYKYHATSRFIDDLCTINDDDEFSKSFKCIYPGEIVLKQGYCGTHATFLYLDVEIEDEIFVYIRFDKRDKFLFFIVHMPHFQSNVPAIIFYGSIFSEFLHIARWTLKLEHFLPRSQKSFQRHPDVLKKYGKNYNELLQELKNYLSSKQSWSNQYFLFIRFVMENVLITNNHCI